MNTAFVSKAVTLASTCSIAVSIVASCSVDVSLALMLFGLSQAALNDPPLTKLSIACSVPSTVIDSTRSARRTCECSAGEGGCRNLCRPPPLQKDSISTWRCLSKSPLSSARRSWCSSSPALCKCARKPPTALRDQFLSLARAPSAWKVVPSG